MTKQEVIQKVRETKILPLTNDLIFKKIFSKDECNSELKDLLEGILEIKIQKVEVKNPELPKNILGEKLARLDIKAKINDEITLDIEMQTRDEYNLGNRSLVYLSKLISPQLMPGDEYKYLKKTIAIWILNFNFFKTNTYHNIAHMRFDKIKKEEYIDMGYKEENGLVTENAEIHFIELPKFVEKNPGIKRKLDQWLWLLTGKEDEIKMAEKVNEEVKKAKKELEVMSMNPKEREEYEERELARWSYYSEMEAAKRVGKEEGIKIGKADGIKIGKVDGKNENKKEIAKKMLNMGFKIEEISKITELSVEEIEKL
mgnify:CR=1 FL=1